MTGPDNTNSIVSTVQDTGPACKIASVTLTCKRRRAAGKKKMRLRLLF